MNTHYLIPSTSATPEYVLEVLRELHRVMGIWGDTSVELSMDTSVKVWREACDLAKWRHVANWMNEFWEIDCPDAAWREVLEPAKKKTLRDVCEFIARHAKRPRIHPATFFGRECAPAGAFLTIRFMLHKAGIDVKHIAPSTALDFYAWKYQSEIFLLMARLAPGVLPEISIKDRWNAMVGRGVLGGLLAFGIGLCGGLPLLVIRGAAALGMGIFWFWFISPYRKPEHIAFGELRTFRDLAFAVVAAAPGQDGRAI